MAEPLTPGQPVVASLSAAPAPEPLRLFDFRAILIAALVLVMGAALGAGLYAAQQNHSSWLPRPRQDGSGWRIVDAHGRRFSGLSLDGDRLTWQDGPLILLMDQDSGKIRLLGPGPEDSSTWQPAVSDEYAVWFEGQGGGAEQGDVYAYDLSTRRRRLLAPVIRPASYVAASGSRAVWTELRGDGDHGELVVLDLSTGARSAVATKAGEPLIDGDLVALKRSGAGGDSIATLDLGTGREWPVVTANGGDITGFGLSGRTLAWSWTDATTGAGRVLVRDVDTGVTTLVATALDLSSPAIDGRTIVWTQAASSGGAEIIGRRLGAPPFHIGTTAGVVEAIQVSGDSVAWLARERQGSVIHTARLPR